MKRVVILFSAALLLPALPALAQPHRGPGPAADPSQALEVLGTVMDFTAELGAGMPTLTVDDAALGEIDFRLGPLWFVQEAGFSVALGDQVEALLYPCTTCTVPYVAAYVDNLTTGASVVLRDEDGYPLWTRRGGTGGGRPFCGQNAAVQEQRGPRGGDGPNGNMGSGQGNGPSAGPGPGSEQGNGPQGGPGPGPNSGANSGPHSGQGAGPNAGPGPGGGQGNGPGAGPGAGGYPGGQCEWAGPDMSEAVAVTGTAVSLEVGFGPSRPSVILEVDGEEMVIFLMPYAPLAAAGFLIEPGAELEMTVAPWLAFGGDEVWVAISVTDLATGLTVQLRDPETGYPVTGGGGGFGPHYGYGPGPGGDP